AGQDVTFLQWTLIGAPLAVVLTLLAWFILSVLVKPEIDEVQGLDNVKEKRKELGSLTRDEMKFSVIFGITLLLWLTQTWTKLDLTLISLTCSAVFFLPKVDLMD
ncbi:anion permease, partial [Eggerthella lenta]|uniref:anion permease n=2 Tax=Bacillati TaxID=1783272 RepID=UPI001D06D503